MNMIRQPVKNYPRCDYLFDALEGLLYSVDREVPMSLFPPCRMLFFLLNWCPITSSNLVLFMEQTP